MNVTTTCRDLAQLLPVAQTACRLLFQECYKAGIRNIFVTETYRSQERQNYLYAQGRTRPGAIVTWTLKSNHSSKLAWDIAVAPPQLLYDVTVLNKVGAIAQKLGITWGGQKSWVDAGKTDRPHFEVLPTWQMPKGYKLEGQVIVPSNSKMQVQLIIEDNENNEPIKELENMLTTTGRNAIKELLKKARKDGLINKDVHTDEAIEKYDDVQLLSYQAAVINRAYE
ncbi:peptidoglycan L-alanyl-D-glutamate endopeptidase [[Bacillus] sp. KCTC 13219]|nr:peptidoglycan L-alanyl-D-glutamate endopeptidase [[Bacillus] sp. KCTC 13219]